MRASAGLLIAGLALAAIGCTGDRGKPAGHSASTQQLSVAALATYDTQGVAMDALTSGGLRFERKGATLCSYVGTTPVLWPVGFSSDGTTLRDPKGQTAAVAGEGLVIGGGFRGPGASTACSPAQAEVWLASGEIVERHQQ